MLEGEFDETVNASIANDLSVGGERLDLLWGELVASVGVSSGLAWNDGTDDEAKYLLGCHPNLLVETMWAIVKSGDTNGCFGLAGNPDTPGGVLDVLRTFDNTDVRSTVIRNPNVSVDLLQVMPGDDFEEFSALAAGFNTPGDVLTILANYEVTGSTLVTEYVAGNLNTPVDVLVGLAGSSSQNVLQALVLNPNTPVGVAGEVFKRFPVKEWIDLGMFDSSWVVRDWLELIPVGVFMEVLKGEYPDVHEGMPRDWLWKLLVASY